MMESVSRALCRDYVARAGAVLHFNLDKAMLAAGRSSPRLGGGEIVEPMRIVLGDRATYEYDGIRFDVADIVETAAKKWLRKNLRFVDPDENVIFQNEIKPGSAELVGLFERSTPVANDTSAAVGYAPSTPLERLVLDIERTINGPAFKQRFPEAGEDVKVMGVRRGGRVHLTVAIAFVDRFVATEADYFEQKAAIRDAVSTRARKAAPFDDIIVDLNTLDEPGSGEEGMYLTVTGTSAEGADSGEVGRGNPVQGVISLSRPAGAEAAPGKNPARHVGKIYGLLAQRVADRIVAELPQIEEAYIYLCSQIGRPIDDPVAANLQLVLPEGLAGTSEKNDAAHIMRHELTNIGSFIEELVARE